MFLEQFHASISNDLNTPDALLVMELALLSAPQGGDDFLSLIERLDSVLGLNLLTLSRTDLRIRPKSATISEAEVEATLAARKEARAAKDFATSDRLRDELAAKGVEVMDGDPLGWEWRLGD